MVLQVRILAPFDNVRRESISERLTRLGAVAVDERATVSESEFDGDPGLALRYRRDSMWPRCSVYSYTPPCISLYRHYIRQLI